MPSPYAEATSPRTTKVMRGRKPHKARLPGLDIGPVGRVNGKPVLWRCYLDELFAN